MTTFATSIFEYLQLVDRLDQYQTSFLTSTSPTDRKNRGVTEREREIAPLKGRHYMG